MTKVIGDVLGLILLFILGHINKGLIGTMTYQSHLVTFKEQRAFKCAKALQEGFETESRQAFC
jgi:hypothetical protein